MLRPALTAHLTHYSECMPVWRYFTPAWQLREFTHPHAAMYICTIGYYLLLRPPIRMWCVQQPQPVQSGRALDIYRGGPIG